MGDRDLDPNRAICQRGRSPTATRSKLGGSGPATIASYTIAHARGGEPEWGLVIADVDGGRAYGRVEDPDLLGAMEAEEWVGREIHVETQENGVNLVRA